MRALITATLFIIWLPILAGFGLAQIALALGARSWDDTSFALIFTVITFGLIALGSWTYGKFFDR